MTEFTERELKEIYFALLYAHNFSHGTDGHNRLILIAKLAEHCPNEDVQGFIATAKGAAEQAIERQGQ